MLVELILLVFVLAWGIISWVEYFTFKRYLSTRYPVILSWLKGGPYFQKQTIYFSPLYNVNRAFDLIFQESNEFSKAHEKEAALLHEYQKLICEKRFLWERRIHYTYF